MSLSDLIKTPQAREIWKRHKSRVTLPPELKGRSMLAEPISQRYSVVGQSFDYMVRFLLEMRMRRKGVPVHHAPLISERSLEILRLRHHPDYPTVRAHMTEILEDIAKFTAGDTSIVNDIAGHAQYLGKLDQLYRVDIYDGVPNYDEKVQMDLAALCRVWLDNPIGQNATRRVLLNPEFLAGCPLLWIRS